MTAAAVFTAISQGWAWKERDVSVASVLDEVSSSWTGAAAFPSEIHVELLKAGRIPDPFKGSNEHEVQWIGEREWLYHTKFDVPESERSWKNAELVFEGLDTLCDVYLNGKKILYADNMFRTWTVSLSRDELQDQDNLLLLHFTSAQKLAKELEAQYGRVRAGSTNLGDPSRVYVRKAQYGWRWDWGPELMTCGPYRAISLITYTARIEAANTRAIVSAAPGLSPSFKVDLAVSGDVSVVRGAKVVLKQLDGTVVLEEKVQLSGSANLKNVVSWDLEDKVQLWWPVGYGNPTLYNVDIALLGDDDALLDSQTKRIGFRTVELIQEPLEEPDKYGKGTTFLFEVNGVRIFMGGSNWIPAHNFLTTLTADDYRAWLTLLRDGNQNMVRLWGGGVYEPDVFYDICDELGVLVWQDFQFACGVYPAFDSFVQSVTAEAEDNVKRLRHHPSLALFCGNNEDYQMVLQWGGIDALPARVLYEKVFPDVVAEHSGPPIPYHRGSPYGGKGWDTSDPTIGDVHQWNIWGGKEWPWQEYPFNGGRFISEFGIPSFPDIKTVDYWLDGNTKDRWAQSKAMAQHDRAGSHERRFAIVMNENFRLTSDLETHIYNSQLMQSEAVSLAYRRREWRGKGKQYTAGVLVWQMNDCWPVVSWAIADFFLRAKPVYYTIARELSPISVGMFRTVTQNRENDRPKQARTHFKSPHLHPARFHAAVPLMLTESPRPAVLRIRRVPLRVRDDRGMGHERDALGARRPPRAAICRPVFGLEADLDARRDPSPQSDHRARVPARAGPGTPQRDLRRPIALRSRRRPACRCRVGPGACAPRGLATAVPPRRLPRSEAGREVRRDERARCGREAGQGSVLHRRRGRGGGARTAGDGAVERQRDRCVPWVSADGGSAGFGGETREGAGGVYGLRARARRVRAVRLGRRCPSRK